MSIATTEAPKKHRLRNWLIGGVLAFFAIGVISSLVGQQDKDSVPVADASQKQVKDTKAAGSERKTTGIGMKARDGKFTFTVQKIRTAKSVGGEYLNKKAQ